MQEIILDPLFDEFAVSKRDRERLRRDLNQIRKKDLPTYFHSIRTTFLAIDLARFLRMDPQPFVYGGLIHDYGKTRVSDKVLKKVGRFKNLDRAKMQVHPIDSFKHSVKKDPFSALFAGMHHMHNAKPYPSKLPVGKYPSLVGMDAKAQEYSRVLAIADFWDAIVSRKDSSNSASALTLSFIKARMQSGLPTLKVLINQLFEEGFFNQEKLNAAQERKALMRKAQREIMQRKLARLNRKPYGRKTVIKGARIKPKRRV